MACHNYESSEAIYFFSYDVCLLSVVLFILIVLLVVVIYKHVCKPEEWRTAVVMLSLTKGNGLY
jgi:hypothetical protein